MWVSISNIRLFLQQTTGDRAVNIGVSISYDFMYRIPIVSSDMAEVIF